MRILITGANGLLGQKIVEQVTAENRHELLATSQGSNRNKVIDGYDYKTLDITDSDAVMQVVSEFKPDAVINTAAMTNVDQCENEKEACRKANVHAVENLIAACKATNAQLIHLSTDFVFDGEAGPYVETDHPNPLSFYGQSKYDAEKMIQNSGLENWAIARTIIVYGIGHNLSRGNIVFWVKQMLTDGKEITIVDDQLRSPTLAEDLAKGCLLIAEKGARGIYHLSGPEVLTIYDLALKVGNHYGLNTQLIKPVKTGEFVQPAKRPLRTGFDISKARQELGYEPMSLESALTWLDKKSVN